MLAVTTLLNLSCFPASLPFCLGDEEGEEEEEEEARMDAYSFARLESSPRTAYSTLGTLGEVERTGE